MSFVNRSQNELRSFSIRHTPCTVTACNLIVPLAISIVLFVHTLILSRREHFFTFSKTINMMRCRFFPARFHHFNSFLQFPSPSLLPRPASSTCECMQTCLTLHNFHIIPYNFGEYEGAHEKLQLAPHLRM